MITTREIANQDAIEIKISDRFDFSVLREFRKAYENSNKPVKSYVVNLQGTSYMDSSALGMLLQLREYAGNNYQNVKIINANTEILSILNIANFDKLMSLT